MDKHELLFFWVHVCGVYLMLINVLNEFLLLEVV